MPMPGHILFSLCFTQQHIWNQGSTINRLTLFSLLAKLCLYVQFTTEHHTHPKVVIFKAAVNNNKK